MEAKKKGMKNLSALLIVLIVSLLLILFALAFIVRLRGVYPGWPTTHPDEGTSYSTAINMFYNNADPGRVDYPAGMPLLHLVIYKTFILPSKNH